MSQGCRHNLSSSKLGPMRRANLADHTFRRHRTLRAWALGACAACLLGTAGLAGAATVAVRPPVASLATAQEPLYFALELKYEGKVLASPKLLGVAGKTLRAEKKRPGSSAAEYSLSLLPRSEGTGRYKVDVDLLVPEAQFSGRAGSVSLEHAEERRLKVPGDGGKLEVTMLVMRVRSPEFEALMRLAAGEEAAQPETI